MKRKILSVIICTLFLIQAVFSAQLEEELIFETGKNYRVDSDTKNDIWRDVDEVRHQNIVLKDNAGNTINVFYDLDLKVGDKIPQEIFDAVKKHYNKPIGLVKTNGKTYKNSDVYVDESIRSKIENKETIVMVGIVEMTLYLDTDYTIENLNDGMNGKYIKLKDSSIDISSFDKCIVHVRGGDIPTQDTFTDLVYPHSHCRRQAASAYVYEKYNIGNSYIGVNWNSPNGDVVVTGVSRIDMHADCEGQSSFATCAGRNWYYTGYAAPPYEGTFRYWNYNTPFSINIPSIDLKMD